LTDLTAPTPAHSFGWLAAKGFIFTLLPVERFRAGGSAKKPPTAAIQNRNFSSALFAISLCLPVFTGRRQRGKLLIRLENLIAQTPPLLFVVVWIVHSFVPKREEKVMINLHKTCVIAPRCSQKLRTTNVGPHPAINKGN
jgi:hypothetical protein